MSGSDLSLKLLQALSDRDQKTLRECANHKSVKLWIDKKLDVKDIRNAMFPLSNHHKDITCLCFASGYSNVRAVQQLVQAGANVISHDSDWNTPLHWAVGSETEAKQKVEYLLSCDASLVSAHNKFNNTPLFMAAGVGDDTSISVLLQHGAEVDERCWYGRTALHHASSEGHVACIDALMIHGADVEARDSQDKETPLHLAAEFNHPACVKVLLDKHNASINAADYFGRTALHKAADEGNLAVVKLLTSYSECDVNAIDGNGATAADFARDEGYIDIALHLMAQL